VKRTSVFSGKKKYEGEGDVDLGGKEPEVDVMGEN